MILSFRLWNFHLPWSTLWQSIQMHGRRKGSSRIAGVCGIGGGGLHHSKMACSTSPFTGFIFIDCVYMRSWRDMDWAARFYFYYHSSELDVHLTSPTLLQSRKWSRGIWGSLQTALRNWWSIMVMVWVLEFEFRVIICPVWCACNDIWSAPGD